MTKDTPMSVDEIADMILAEVDEVVNHCYISELSCDIPERYRHMKSALFSSILHCVNEFYKTTDSNGLPTDEIYAQVGEKVWNESEFTSPEFIRGIIATYKQRIEDYNEIHKDADGENSSIREAISKLLKSELRIAVAKAQGIDVVCERWPCEYGVDRTGLDTAIDVHKDGDEWVPVCGLETDRDFDLQYPVTRAYTDGWPPKKSTISFAEDDWMEARVEPIPNFSDDVLVAMSLVSDLKHHGPEVRPGFWPEGFEFEIRESITERAYKCTFSRNTTYEIIETGKAETLPQAICRAYLMVVLIHLAPQIQGKVLNLEEPDNER